MPGMTAYAGLLEIGRPKADRGGRVGIGCGRLGGRQIALNAGIRYVYTGNIYDPAGQSTYCHSCGATLIGRDWYDLTTWNLTADGGCGRCGACCNGVFEPVAGRWGRRRQPVRLPVCSPRSSFLHERV